jgi:hypothetical protein
MNAVGLVIGLPGLFTSCLELYDKFSTWKQKDADLLVYYTQIEFQRMQFRGLRQMFFQRSDYQSLSNLIKLVLQSTHQILREIVELWSKHGPFLEGSSAKKINHSIGWVASDKRRMTELVGQLEKQMVILSQLLLTRPQQEALAFQARAQSILTANRGHLRDIYTALHDGTQCHDVVLAAQIMALTMDIETESEVNLEHSSYSSM